MSIETERILRPLELRAEGRRLEGIALKYGEISPNHQERFLPGAFSLDPGTTRWLDYRHDRTRVLAHTEGGGLTLRDSSEALLLEAELPNLPLSEKALDEISSGTLSGLSIEFRAERESRDGSVRVVEKADLAGIGLVASPSFPASRGRDQSGRNTFRQHSMEQIPGMRMLWEGSEWRGWKRTYLDDRV